MFSKRLTLAFGILAIIALCQGMVAWWAIDSASNNVIRGRVASDMLSGFIELSATKQRLRTWLSQALLDAGADPQQRDGYQKDMAATLARIEALADTSAELNANQFPQNSEHKLRKEALGVLRVSLEELKSAMASTRAIPANSGAKAAWTEITRVFNVSQGLDLRTLLADSIARERIAVERERAAADKSLRLVRGLAFGATLALALAAMLLAAYFVRALHRPLRELTAGAQALQRGDLDHHIPDGRDDEFARFATNVNAMAVELAQHRQIETATRQRLEGLVAVRTSELEQALQTLQQLDIRRRKLFADISHELRTPTTAIRGEAEIALRGGEKPGSEYRASLRRIVETAAQLGIVIDDLLTMARSDIDTLALTGFHWMCRSRCAMRSTRRSLWDTSATYALRAPVAILGRYACWRTPSGCGSCSPCCWTTRYAIPIPTALFRRAPGWCQTLKPAPGGNCRSQTMALASLPKKCRMFSSAISEATALNCTNPTATAWACPSQPVWPGRTVEASFLKVQIRQGRR